MKLYLPFTKAFQDLHRLGSGGDGSLELKTMPPRNPDNIPICTTYHVMIMALQNAILEHYATPQELFNDDRINFMIKREHRKDPIMYAGKQGGRGLKTLKSASAASFSTYLSKRALENGFSANLTMYAFRRAAATQIDRTAGRDAVRRPLHHIPDSFTQE